MLADFIVDFAPNVTPQADKELINLTERSNSKWTLSVDGSSNVNRSGIDLVLTSPEGDRFKATNKEGGYEALIAGLNLAKDMGIKKLDIRSNSQTSCQQTFGNLPGKGSQDGFLLGRPQLGHIRLSVEC